MVTHTHSFPDAEPDDLAASRQWLTALTSHYPEDDCIRIGDACELMIACRGEHLLETGETEAAVDLAREYLGYEGSVSVEEGLRQTVEWYQNNT